MAAMPAAYVINLERSPDRLSDFRKLNRRVEDVARFPAVDGRSLDRSALVATGYLSENLPWGLGTVGCAMSHVKLWELAVREEQSITVFEDDVVLSYHFHTRASEVLAALPKDWDMILWGCRLNPSFAWIDLGETKVELHGYGGPRYRGAHGFRDFQDLDHPRTSVKLLHAFGHHAYSISAKGAKAALDYFLPIQHRLITFPDAGVRVVAESKDVDLCGLYPSMNAFLCIPSLALPGADGSDRELIDALATEAIDP